MNRKGGFSKQIRNKTTQRCQECGGFQFFWLLSTRLIALRSCLLSRQQRLEVTTKVWSRVLGTLEVSGDLGQFEA